EGTIFDRPLPTRGRQNEPQKGVDGSNHIRVGSAHRRRARTGGQSPPYKEFAVGSEPLSHSSASAKTWRILLWYRSAPICSKVPQWCQWPAVSSTCSAERARGVVSPTSTR